MYVGIDVGGSKTLVAVFSNKGKVSDEVKFPTPKKYPDFLDQLREVFKQKEFQNNIKAVCCAVPGTIDREHGVGKTFGNLPWKNVQIKRDLEKIFNYIPVFTENDAKLAGVYEAAVLKGWYKKIVYITISTGIGAGVIVDGKIDPVLADSEVGFMLIDHNGRLEKWEDFASGRALVKKYGKKASEIDDPKIWEEYAKLVSPGIDAILAVVQPEAIVIGGGVGAHLEKFKPFLVSDMKKRYENKLVHIPPIIKAQRAEEAAIYGCYEYIHQNIA